MNAPHPTRAAYGALAKSVPAEGQTLARSVGDFLRRLDAGDFGQGHRFSDGTESAFVTGLREELAAYRADRALVARSHERGRALAAELYDAGATARAPQVAALDMLARDAGLPLYSEIAEHMPAVVAGLDRAERSAADLYAALRASEQHHAAAEACLITGGEVNDEEALDRAARGRRETGIALSAAEMRADLDDCPGVTVLAEARERLRAAGRCA